MAQENYSENSAGNSARKYMFVIFTAFTVLNHLEKCAGNYIEMSRIRGIFDDFVGNYSI